MFIKIGVYLDKKHFGNRVIIYSGDKEYLLIIKDRDEIGYFFVDNTMNKIYPVNSYMRNIGFVCDTENPIEQIHPFDIDISTYGYYVCPEHLKKIIKLFA